MACPGQTWMVESWLCRSFTESWEGEETIRMWAETIRMWAETVRMWAETVRMWPDPQILKDNDVPSSVPQIKCNHQFPMNKIYSIVEPKKMWTWHFKSQKCISYIKTIITSITYIYIHCAYIYIYMKKNIIQHIHTEILISCLIFINDAKLQFSN